MYRLPGLSVRAGAVVMELAEQKFPDWDMGVGRPRLLSLYEALRMTLIRLRRNNTYEELGEDFGVARQTAWNYVQEIVVFLADELGCADTDSLCGLVEGKVCLVDGSLVVVFNWRHRKDLYSGKHRRYGVNIQV
ncbi:transposase family protein, partial [Frankia sp. Cas4]|uniref:transposase family protein n=1 Tax=Frankia sp. Cas4 TaxID=3073927 RepID=UPI002AD51BA8